MNLRLAAGLMLALVCARCEAQVEGQPKPPRTPLSDRLKLPADLPGSDAAMITLPDLKPENAAKRREAIEKAFPRLEALRPEPQPAPGPDGKPLTLQDLQQMALANSPTVRQAMAGIDAAQGAAIQAGLHPNPRVGYEGTDINEGGTAGKQGAIIEQLIKTGGKLQLARASAMADVRNAETALRKAEITVTTHVRRSYFAVLAARQSVQIARALVDVSDEVYRIQVERLRIGDAAPYEPLQARVLAVQARVNLVQARNRYDAAWKQLAAALSQPAMPLTALSGRLDAPVPTYVYSAAYDRVLTGHTDVAIAVTAEDRARIHLRQAQVAPIPDVTVSYTVQRDYTASPMNVIHGVGVTVPLPLWDRNQGGIRQAQGQLAQAAEEVNRVRNDLAGELAAAFEKYNNARTLLQLYRDQILPDQVRAFRGMYLHYDRAPEGINFNDVVTAQQTLSQSVIGYVAALGNVWEAAVDVANLLQIDDLYDAGKSCAGSEEVLPIPEVHRPSR